MRIYANTGYVLTNGITYGKIIDLGYGDREENYYSITEKEYEKILEELEND